MLSIADLKSGAVDTLRAWRTAEGISASFAWRDLVVSRAHGRFERFICNGGRSQPSPGGLTHLVVAISPTTIEIYIDGVSQQKKRCDASMRRSETRAAKVLRPSQ